ncbi:MAG: isoprenylcysteine carboxylmethyltransferase family protein, partial [Candidatus Lokiarchaeota archaeon]
LIKKNPGILNERGKILKEGTKLFDKVFTILWLPLNLVSMAIMALDFRFSWSNLPFWTLFLGIFLTIPGFIIGIKAMLSNPYFELNIRIQEDRNQKVISTGPYKFIRHPGYVSETIMLFTAPLILGSFWGFVPNIVLIIIFIIRTAIEDRMLRKELSGYADYAKKTKYRLIPYIW